MNNLKQDHTCFEIDKNEEKLPKLSSSINIEHRKNKPRSQTQQERRSIHGQVQAIQNNKVKNMNARNLLQVKSQREQQAMKKNYSQSVTFLNMAPNSINSKGQKIAKNNYNTNLDQIKSKQLIYQSSLLIKIKQKNNKTLNQNNNSQLRSRVLSTFIPAMIEQSNLKSNPYDKFIKQLNIKLPTPEEKFKEFVRIPPFNRLKNHTQFISHMLQKISSFFRNHPSQIVENIAKKVIELHPENISENYLVVLSEGFCTYKGKKIEQGMLIARKNFSLDSFEHQDQINLIGVPCHEYSGFLTAYLRTNKHIFQKFIESMQIFKIFSQEGLSKIYSSLEINFYQKGELLYQPGEIAQDLFVIYEGCAARKIIIQIDKTNKIPLQKFSKLVKIISTSYEHRIQFLKEDLVGIADIVDNIYKRSEDIIIDEDSTILAIKRGSVQQNLDEYIIDRLRKYNMKKYPKNYDELCEKYLKSKSQNRKAEQRKIQALKDEIYRDSHNERKGQKINQIIKIYQKRIKLQEKQHLVNVKSIQRQVKNDI